MARKFDGVILCALAGGFFASPVHAQNSVWSIDSVNSTARLFVASSSRRDARINVGVARLNGEMRQNAGDSPASAFDFQIYPADKNAGPVKREGQRAVTEGVNGTSSTSIRFQSKAVEPVDENTLRVKGDLTATYTSWSARYEPTKDYSGPIYGPPVVHSMTREVVFTFRKAPRAEGEGERRGNTEWSASTTISSEAFPVLWNAVVGTYWPTFVVEEQCVSAEAGAEDYSGPVCEGKVVEPLPRTDMHCAMASMNGNESCTGTPLVGLVRREDETRASGAPAIENASQPQANEIEIELDLRLENPAPAKPPVNTGNPVAASSMRVKATAGAAFLTDDRATFDSWCDRYPDNRPSGGLLRPLGGLPS